LEVLRRRIVAEDPIDLRSVRIEEKNRRGRPDAEFVEDGLSVGLLGCGLEEDEILGQVILILGVFEELLTEQFAAPSRIRIEIEEQLLVLGLGLSQRFVEGTFKKVVLGESDGGEEKKRGNNGDFFHAAPPRKLYANTRGECKGDTLSS
jgi:hypothetical protein